MLSWDEVDNEDTGAAVIKGANAGHASEANMDRLDGAGAAAALEARNVTASDSAAIIRAKAALDKLDVAEGLAELEGSAARVAVDEKRMINCRADLTAHDSSAPRPPWTNSTSPKASPNSKAPPLASPLTKSA
ncbi:hypothetical protein ASE80_05625 [Pseudomonas sp. Leaf15]|nr:hypothetical protein ASE80_05625 [Pseudomonas sp. Leaf15]